MSLPDMMEWAKEHPDRAAIRIDKLERDLAWYKHEWERLDDRNEALEVENARLQMELDASCNAEELRQVRVENAALREILNRLGYDETGRVVFQGSNTGESLKIKQL